MGTLTSASTCPHSCIRVSTGHPTGFIDLTARLEAFVTATGLRSGILNVQTRHTTTAIVVNEHEPLLLADFEELLAGIAPVAARYRHHDAGARTVNLTAAERPNGHAHCRALLLPSSASLNVFDGRLQLGTWQRVFFVELDGPRDRDVSVLAFGEFAHWRSGGVGEYVARSRRDGPHRPRRGENPRSDAGGTAGRGGTS
jgi:secondary thiamine-phosphate synthase enzyme